MNSHTEHSSETRKLAFNWLFAAGAVALAFGCCLFFTDRYLSNSTGELDNAKVMTEMRRSQTTQPSHVADDRQLRGVPWNAVPQSETDTSH